MNDSNPWSDPSAILGNWMLAQGAYLGMMEHMLRMAERRQDAEAIDRFENEGGAIHEKSRIEMIPRKGHFYIWLPNGRKIHYTTEQFQVIKLLSMAARGEDVKEYARELLSSIDLLDEM